MSEKERIEASLFLASYFDTLGFKNGDWEFFGGKIEDIIKFVTYYNFIVYQYFSLGGSDIDISKWISIWWTNLIFCII